MLATFHCWLEDGSRRINVRYVPSSLLLRRGEVCEDGLFGKRGATGFSRFGLLSLEVVSSCNSFRMSSKCC